MDDIVDMEVIKSLDNLVEQFLPESRVTLESLDVVLEITVQVLFQNLGDQVGGPLFYEVVKALYLQNVRVFQVLQDAHFP